MESRATTGIRGRRICRSSYGMLKAKTYGVGRVCAVKGCGTRLSAYNPSTVCALHTGSWQDAYQQAAHKTAPRDEMVRTCAFDGCGREFTTTNPAKKYCCDACRMRAFQARVTAARRVGEANVAGARRAC